MSDYTPTTEEMRAFYTAERIDVHPHLFPKPSAEEAEAEFDRWLAAHDAEVRTSVISEEPEWEYGTALRTMTGHLWDFEFEGSRETAEWHVKRCAEGGHDHGMDHCVVVRRAPRISHGDWELVDREAIPDA